MKRTLKFHLHFRKIHDRNPFINFFVCFALICCLALGIIFLYFTHNQQTSLQTDYNQEKIDLLMEDLELQLQSFEKMALRLSLDQKYYYSILKQEKYNEKVMLLDFENYQFSSILTEEIFLYYNGQNNIFHVTGNTINLDIYLINLSEEERNTVKYALQHPESDRQMISVSHEIYILNPFKAGDYSSTSPYAVLVYVISYEQLTRHFESIIGGLNGTLALYAEDTLVYCNQDTSLPVDSNDVLTTATSDGRYVLRYLPEETPVFHQFSLLQFTLIILDVFLILAMASLFANRAYSPLRSIHEKFQSKGALSNDKQYKNVLEELEDLIDDTLQHNAFTVSQIAQIQEMLKQQIMRHLLNGTHSQNIQLCLDKLGILLPGPFYYAICIAFSSEDISEDFFLSLQNELERISTSCAGDRVYTIYDNAKKQFGVICSLEKRENEKEMTEYVVDVAESYSYKPAIGIGKVYGSLAQLSASWLESMDNLDKGNDTDCASGGSFVYEAHTLHWLTESLTIGSRDAALEGLEDFIRQQKANHVSALMQRYMFAEFLGEISKLSRMNQIDLSNHNISLVIAAKGIDDFHLAARELITEYCDILHSQIQSKKLEEAQQVCRYIRAHYPEYDISIESVAENLNISVAAVREAVPLITKKTYKDYIVYLRMEHAKKLLREENISVAEACAAVGYSNVSHFIKLFKEATGMTPAKYVKNLTQNQG